MSERIDLKNIIVNIFFLQFVYVYLQYIYIFNLYL